LEIGIFEFRFFRRTFLGTRHEGHAAGDRIGTGDREGTGTSPGLFPERET
jgi:hypothetical protein